MDRYTSVRTQLGTIAIGFHDRGIGRILLPDADWSAPSRGMLERAGLRTESAPPPNVAALGRALQKHIAGETQDFSGVDLDTSDVADFTQRVHRAARAIPAGEVRTYGQLAETAGSPSAVRAAGRAMATNRWPIVVPCHRVFARGGFGEYSASSGLHTKLRLLWREGYRGRTSNVVFDEHAATQHLSDTHPALAELIDKAGPFTLQAVAPRSRGGSEPFAALAKAVISQQLAGNVAKTIYARVAALLGGATVDDPDAFLALPAASLRAAGLSQNKTLALTDLARHAADGSLPSRAAMESMSDEDIIERLVEIRGIGRWSAQMLLIFYLGRSNVLPTLDLGVRKGFALTYGLRKLPSEQAIERAALAWAPYASVASWYMWRAVEIYRYGT